MLKPDNLHISPKDSKSLKAILLNDKNDVVAQGYLTIAPSTHYKMGFIHGCQASNDDDYYEIWDYLMFRAKQEGCNSISPVRPTIENREYQPQHD